MPQGAPPLSVDLKLQSDPACVAPARRRIEAFAAECGFDARGCDEIGLCLNEALANVIRHAYGGAPGRPIAVQAEFRDDVLSIRIRDWGNGVDPGGLPRRRRDPLEPGGVGMICLRELMDEVRFVPQPDGMLLLLRRRRRDGA